MEFWGKLTIKAQRHFFLGVLHFLIIYTLSCAIAFAQNQPSPLSPPVTSPHHRPTVTFVLDIDGVLLRPTDNSSQGMAEPLDAYPPNQRLTYEQIRPGRTPSQTQAVLTQGAPEFLLSLSRISGARIVFFSRETEQSNINRLRAIHLPDGRSAYDLILPGDLFSLSPTLVTQATIPMVGSWDDQSRKFSVTDPELYREPLAFSREYMDRSRSISVKHYELIPGFDPDSTLIIEDHTELRLRGQTEMPVMPALRSNVIPLPGTLARLSAAGAENWFRSRPGEFANVHQVNRRNLALNQLFAARGVIDQVLAQAADQHRSIREVNAEIAWREAPRPVTINGREYWTEGQINTGLFESLPNYARGLRLLRAVNPGLRLNASAEREAQQCASLRGILTDLQNTRP